MSNPDEPLLTRGTTLVDRRLFGVPKYYFTPQPDESMRVPDQVTSCVCFLGVEKTKNNMAQMSFRGTGFVMALKEEGAYFAYLVTAYHNLIEIGDREFVIRVNNKAGSTIQYRLKGASDWIRHDDTSVDAAVIPFPYLLETEVAVIYDEMFLNEDNAAKCQIGIGSDVFIVGLFTPHHGNARNQPILRMGNIAMIPKDRVEVKNFGKMEAYLIESRSIGGLSGSPVFVRHHPNMSSLHYQFLFMGMVQGHWNKRLETTMDSATETGEIEANMGVAIVTPAAKILEILRQPQVVAQRKATREQVLAAAAHKTVADKKADSSQTQ